MKSMAQVTLAVACAACSPPETTAVRLTVSYEEAWALEELGVTAGERAERTEVRRELRVLLPDEMAGSAVTIEVDGRRGGARMAHGAVEVVPALHGEVTAHVALSRLPCGAWCSAGERECRGDAVVTCEADADGCPAWSAAAPCGDDTPYCSLGACAAECIHECAAGETRCDGPGQVRSCGQGDADDCLEWLAPVACADGQVCSNGACADACADECTVGAVMCAGGGTRTCGDLDADGCTEWGPMQACPAGQTCSGGACSAMCADDCSEATCEGLVHRACGHYDADPCLDLSPGTSCVPADACREGACDAAAGCLSAPKVCELPPESVCTDGDTLRVYDAMGTCSGGTCSYTARDVDCPSCPACDACAGVTCTVPPEPTACYEPTGTCTAGACDYGYADGASCNDGNACTTGDSCLGGACSGTPVSCAGPPPAPTCISATTLRTHSAPGTCTGGTCSYPFTDTACPGTCTSGACNGATLSTSYEHTCAVTSSGGVKCWGRNDDGQLGDGTTTDRSTPVSVSGLSSGVVSVAAGFYHTCALTSGGGVKCWGNNAHGQLGDGTTTDRSAPVTVSELTSGTVAIAAGGFYTCAVTSGGGVKCWGSNAYGQLGDGTTTDRSTPVNVTGLSSGVVAVAAGGHTCAAMSGGGVKCWGRNTYGQLGDGTTTHRSTPVSVSGLSSGIMAIAAGMDHTCAATSGGGVKCWGRNTYGQLGDGTTTHRSTPVSVSGLSSGVVGVAAGGYHTCAATSGAGVNCWGLNGYGALGDGSTSTRTTPVNVAGTGGAVSVAAGHWHTCAVTSGGGVKCWGGNHRGQLGDGTTTDRLTPVDVSGL